jgi:hypothetical protein
MVARREIPEYSAAVTGLNCPACGRCEMVLSVDAGSRAALTCYGCGVTARLLRRRGDPEPAFDLDDATADVPPKGSWWIGYVKGSDRVCRPVALAPTMSSAWDALLHCPLRGALYLVPCDPPR